MEDAPQMEVPRYRCHKVVHALKLDEIETDDGRQYGRLFPADKRYAPIDVGMDFMLRIKSDLSDPGYYVVYEDGYKSWSPTKAFEDGYSKIEAPRSFEELEKILQEPDAQVHVNPDGSVTT